MLVDTSYIGPLRDRPKRYYNVSGDTPRTVGSRGENAANLFRRKQSTLKPKLDEWVKRFEFGDAIVCKDVTDDLFALYFKRGRSLLNVADAGFGASQVLPLLIQGLAASDDSLTIAEQPEIHLNPKLQCVLADLLVAMANAKHRVLIETHSEHLLIRLRRLVAERAIDAADLGVYYVEQESGVSESSRGANRARWVNSARRLAEWFFWGRAKRILSAGDCAGEEWRG